MIEHNKQTKIVKRERKSI